MRDKQKISSALLPGQPLWSRAPTKGEDGKPLGDFMMLIPHFAKWPEIRKSEALLELQQLFSRYEETVVFADLNLKLNLLWVSLRPGRENCLELAAAVRERIPEAVLVANPVEALLGKSGKERRRFGIKRISHV